MDLMCQAIKSTQSSVPSHPFPPPGQRQGPSIPAPGQSILADLCNARSPLTTVKGGNFSPFMPGTSLIAFLSLYGNYPDSLLGDPF